MNSYELISDFNQSIKQIKINSLHKVKNVMKEYQFPSNLHLNVNTNTPLELGNFNQSFNTTDKIKNIWFNAWCKNIFDYMEHLIEHNVEFMVSIGNIFFYFTETTVNQLNIDKLNSSEYKIYVERLTNYDPTLYNIMQVI